MLNASPAPPDGMPRGSEVSDSTFQMANKLITNRRLRYMENVITSIENVIEGLPPEKLEVIRLKYWTRAQSLTNEGIAQAVNCDKTNVWRWCNDVCRKIGIEMGIVNYLD